MQLEDTFPEDPCVPSLRYAASSQMPVSVPWSERRISLGAGFKATDDPTKEPVTKGFAFDANANQDGNLHFRPSSRFKIADMSSSNSLDYYSHLDLAIGASVGCSWAGASGRGTINELSKNNKRTAQASSRAETSVGSIAFQHYPPLSSKALEILSDAQDPETAFRQQYGDYFVSAVFVGAVNSTLVAGDFLLAMRTKDIAADVTGKFLGLKKTKHYEDHEQEGGAQGLLSLASFDSLDQTKGKTVTARTLDEVDALQWNATFNKAQAAKLFQRTHDAIRGMKLDQPSQSLVNELCDKGWISELQLVPYSLLRDYAAAILQRRHLGQKWNLAGR